MIDLYSHNKTAYKSVCEYLKAYKKAAVIHPTGTGKSFIAFKLCEDNPDKKILWLSPSEYIFKTQIDSVSKQGFKPKNITFYTYAKLTFLGDAEIKDIQPDYIILDEFHRAGAVEWGKRVNYLLNIYNGVPLLGLSATNIRYLDNKRDMAEELFEGCVASYMTLGEAIVRGILLPPTYVTAIYSFKGQLDKIENRVKAQKNKFVRDNAEKYLDSLRRAIENADGLDVIFSKYITKKDSKFIIFCPNFESMEKLKEKSREMFGKIDINPHIYSVYSEDTQTDKAFQAFNKDKSESLKLLYCIDMLNEGIHVEGVDGVILFRPTVSPIIYKQQIGRALSATKSKQPIIFDIVNNFENLYSVGSIEQEMEQAVGYYRMTGQYAEIVNTRFMLIDEARDYRKIFDSIEDVLTSSWDYAFEKATEYYTQNGNLNVPQIYRTDDGYPLGRWVSEQRRAYHIDNISKEHIDKLTQIGMVWESRFELGFVTGLDEAKAYYTENGNLAVPLNYKTKSGFALGNWISNLRVRFKEGVLTEEQIEALTEIGMDWNRNDKRWEENYAVAEAYYRGNGHLNVPHAYKTEDGVALGRWLVYLRSKKDELTDEQVARLEQIGMQWDKPLNRAWQSNVELLKEYKAEYGDVNVPQKYRTVKGEKLGQWLRGAKDRAKHGKLSEARRQELIALGVAL
jgi:superfamily II DNA or RNA helicase